VIATLPQPTVFTMPSLRAGYVDVFSYEQKSSLTSKHFHAPSDNTPCFLPCGVTAVFYNIYLFDPAGLCGVGEINPYRVDEVTHQGCPHPSNTISMHKQQQQQQQ